MGSGGLDIAQRASTLQLDFLRKQLSEFAGRHAHREHSGSDLRPRGHDGTRRDQGILADLRPIEHDRPDPDQRAIMNPTAMYDGAVTHRDFMAQKCREAIGRDVERGLILDIRALANANSLDIAAQDRSVEDARVLTDLDIANDGGPGRDPDTRVQPGASISEGSNDRSDSKVRRVAQG
jgi:hypothetical protein